MISFAGKVKSELCRVGLNRQCCARAEGYGVLLYGNTFTATEVRIITENSDFAARLSKLFQKAFGVKFDRMPEDRSGRGKLIFGITAPEKLEKIINILGYDARQLTALHVNFGLLEEDCCRTAFLRGAFLAGGSVTDPEKRYHLELATNHMPASREVQVLMEEMGFLPRTIRRGADALLYFKQSEHIEDFLTKIGAGFLRVPESGNVLDNTGVHPESYAAAEQLLALCGFSDEDVRRGAVAQLGQKAKAMGEAAVAEKLGIGVPTLRDVVKELMKPGRDLRSDLPAPILRTDVLEMKDLKPGMVLTGTVRNVIDFGVFVDIGVHQDGLVHISQVSNKFIKHPSEIVAVGDIVKVVVLDVDEKKHRISLSMKQVKE